MKGKRPKIAVRGYLQSLFHQKVSKIKFYQGIIPFVVPKCQSRCAFLSIFMSIKCRLRSTNPRLSRVPRSHNTFPSSIPTEMPPEIPRMASPLVTRTRPRLYKEHIMARAIILGCGAQSMWGRRRPGRILGNGLKLLYKGFITIR